jgi:hypothetical protein
VEGTTEEVYVRPFLIFEEGLEGLSVKEPGEEGVFVCRGREFIHEPRSIENGGSRVNVKHAIMVSIQEVGHASNKQHP